VASPASRALQVGMAPRDSKRGLVAPASVASLEARQWRVGVVAQWLVAACFITLTVSSVEECNLCEFVVRDDSFLFLVIVTNML
jgi:hypothetical protein